jgi:hypothetical protein
LGALDALSIDALIIDALSIEQQQRSGRVVKE